MAAAGLLLGAAVAWIGAAMGGEDHRNRRRSPLRGASVPRHITVSPTRSNSSAAARLGQVKLQGALPKVSMSGYEGVGRSLRIRAGLPTFLRVDAEEPNARALSGSMLGTDSGMQLQYAAVAAGSVLVIGTERFLLVAMVCAVAVALAIALELLVPHDTGLLTPREMRENFIICVVGTSFILFLIVFYAVREITRAEAIAEREFKRSEALLANILPAPVISRLKAHSETIIADAYDDVSILFADIAGSTARASDMPPADFVRFLNELFSIFDNLVQQHGWRRSRPAATATWSSAAPLCPARIMPQPWRASPSL